MKRLHLLALAVALSLQIGCSREQKWNDRRITLEGSKKIEVLPDRVSWDVDIHCVGASIEAAHQSMLDASARLRERGKELGLPPGAFEAKGVRQGTEWEWAEGRRRISNQFFSEFTLTVSISDMALYGKVSERLFLDDALVVSGVRFSCSKREEAYREALGGALADAETKAKFIADKAGVPIVRIERVEVVEDRFAQVAAYSVDVPQKSSAALPAMRPEIVGASVRVTYEIK